jgi:hypothetical protein
MKTFEIVSKIAARNMVVGLQRKVAGRDDRSAGARHGW